MATGIVCQEQVMDEKCPGEAGGILCCTRIYLRSASEPVGPGLPDWLLFGRSCGC